MLLPYPNTTVGYLVFRLEEMQITENILATVKQRGLHRRGTTYCGLPRK